VAVVTVVAVVMSVAVRVRVISRLHRDDHAAGKAGNGDEYGEHCFHAAIYADAQAE
jgi:hypothetical protein